MSECKMFGTWLPPSLSCWIDVARVEQNFELCVRQNPERQRIARLIGDAVDGQARLIANVLHGASRLEVAVRIDGAVDETADSHVRAGVSCHLTPPSPSSSGR